MGYFTSTRNGWYELDNLNLSGTSADDVAYDINTTGTWISVARFDNDNIDLSSITYRSALQEDGSLAPFVTADPTGTSTLLMRILTPTSNIGLNVFSDVYLNGTASLGLTESNFIPFRNIPRNSLLQTKITDSVCCNYTGTENRMHIRFNFTYLGVDPQITSLLD